MNDETRDGRTLALTETMEKLAGVATNFTQCMLRTKDTAEFAREVGDPELAAKIEQAVDAMVAVTNHVHDRLETCPRAAHLVATADRAMKRANGGA